MPALQQADAPAQNDFFLIRDPNTDAFIQVSKTRFLVHQFFEGQIFGIPKRTVAAGVAGVSLVALVLWWMKRNAKSGRSKRGRR